jgi:hypothetical protein
MTSRTSTPRLSAQTLKLVISAASVAATLVGWALLAAPNTPATVQTESPAGAAVTAPPPAWLAEPPIIPTLQPLTGVAQPADTAGFQIANPPALREVSAPVSVNPLVQAQRPAPVVVTRSSR